MAEGQGRGLTRRKGVWIILVLIVLGAAALYSFGVCRDSTPALEAGRLFELLKLAPGMTVAEIGAGAGRMTVLMAQRLGPRGHVFSTELDPDRLRQIQDAVAEAGLNNVTVIQADEREANLPAECCDAIFMVKVYHHLTDPSTTNTDIFEALRPGGRLAVIDFPPRSWRFWMSRPEGVAENRGGHGMPREILIQELTAAGFQIEHTIADWWSWPEQRYCVIARKPIPHR